MSFELRSAERLDDDALAELFTAAYEGYLVPFVIDAAGVRFMTDAYDLDRGASRVAVRNGEHVGLANLGLRGSDAWVGGIGVVTGERRRGTGKALMNALREEARFRGVERIWLEVIAENVQAISLYKRLGYRQVRSLEVWSLPRAAGEARVVDPAEAQAWIRANRTEREPWQRTDASVEKITDARGLLVDGAAAVVRVAGPRVWILQVEGSSDPLRRLLAGASSLGETVGVLNLPTGHPAGAAFAALGGRVDIRQHEMLLQL